ncbi:MAG: hypothetical protein K9N06_09075 [Candidatus Cloacimonetes bacterium]|nr:hypothetical protein [Candidatus Cloacimonadota bacterium]
MSHIRYYLRFYLRILLLIVYTFFSDKRMILPDSFVLWVWILYITNLFLSYYTLGVINTAKDITRIYLNSKSGESNKKVYKMYSALLPNSMVVYGVTWSALEMLSYGLILIYQGLVLGICAEILLFIILAILPVQHKSHLRNIYKHFGEPESKIVRGITESDFDIEEVKSIVEKAINEKIDPHEWWLEIKKDEKS